MRRTSLVEYLNERSSTQANEGDLFFPFLFFLYPLLTEIKEQDKKNQDEEQQKDQASEVKVHSHLPLLLQLSSYFPLG